MGILPEIKKLIKWSDAYYNGEPLVSDSEYDLEYNRIKKLYPNDDYFKQVGAPVNNRNDAVKLPHIMGSLVKENPVSAIDFLNKHIKETILISPKLDGLSLKLVYKKGKLFKVYTRGNGYEGQDITVRGKYISGIRKKINLKDTIEINGECICYKSLFDKYYSSEYKFPRNFCVGTLRPILTNDVYKELLEENEDLKLRLKRIQFIAFSINYKGTNKRFTCESKYAQLLELQVEGFSTIIRPSRRWKEEDQQKYRTNGLDSLARCKRDIKLPYNCLLPANRLSSDYLKDCIDLVKDKLDINCDGIVIEIDNVKRASKLGYEANGLDPKCARAIKHIPIEQRGLHTKIKDIEWNISKRGNFIPTIILNPVNIEGADIKRVSGCNFDYLKSNHLGIGAIVKLIRSGDVIPRIVDTISKSNIYKEPKLCPYCGHKLKVGKVYITCTNKNCSGIKIQKLINFFQIAKVDYMSWSTVEQLVDNGYDTVAKILNITVKQLMKIEGFKETKATKIYNNIKAMRSNISLSVLMHATGIFDNEDTGLGVTKLQWIIDYLGVDNILSNKKINFNALESINGLGHTTASLFIERYDEFYSWYKVNGKFFSLSDFNKVEEGPLSNKVFCWTGFRDKNLKQLIESNGGKIKDNLTKDCDALFSAHSSSKTVRAESLGIPIISSAKAYIYINSLLTKGVQ